LTTIDRKRSPGKPPFYFSIEKATNKWERAKFTILFVLMKAHHIFLLVDQGVFITFKIFEEFRVSQKLSLNCFFYSSVTKLQL
jgi:hypothetical protein